MTSRKGAKRPKPKASGRSLTTAERRAGDEQATKLQVWLPASLVDALDALAEREKSTRTKLTRLALMALLARKGAVPSGRKSG